MTEHTKQPRSKVTAAVLALFLGAFGAHKFYLGRKKAGILYLLFFWTFIPAFIATIDFWILVFESETKFDQKYNQ